MERLLAALIFAGAAVGLLVLTIRTTGRAP